MGHSGLPNTRSPWAMRRCGTVTRRGRDSPAAARSAALCIRVDDRPGYRTAVVWTCPRDASMSLPTPRPSRLAVIDALRGLALLGILLVNLLVWSGWVVMTPEQQVAHAGESMRQVQRGARYVQARPQRAPTNRGISWMRVPPESTKVPCSANSRTVGRWSIPCFSITIPTARSMQALQMNARSPGTRKRVLDLVLPQKSHFM